MNKKIVFFVCLMTVSARGNSNPELPKFYEVVPNKIYRGAQPTDRGIRELAEMQVSTVLDLRNEDAKQIANEGEVVRANHMNFISIPMHSFFAPSEYDMGRIQRILNDKNLQPVFIHCKHGEDRTGLSIGLYRFFSDNWSSKKAESEMISFGFHKQLVGLYFYFKEKTEGDPLDAELH